MVYALKAKSKLLKGGEKNMKRTVSIMLLVCCAVFFSVTTVLAQSTSTTVSATADVPEELTLTASVFRVNSMGTEASTDDTWDPTPVTSMSFGELTHVLDDGTEAGLYYSKPYYYVALLGAFTSGRKYRITSSCLGLTGTAGTITSGFGVTFIDTDPKQSDGTSINPSAPPSGSVVGTPGLASVPGKLLYDSGPTGATRVIGAYFGIPPYKSDGSEPFPGFRPIPVDVPNGTYTGTVTFSLTLY